MEETRSIGFVGRYSFKQLSPEDCKKCKDAKWATVIIDGLCLDCLTGTNDFICRTCLEEYNVSEMAVKHCPGEVECVDCYSKKVVGADMEDISIYGS